MRWDKQLHHQGHWRSNEMMWVRDLARFMEVLEVLCGLGLPQLPC